MFDVPELKSLELATPDQLTEMIADLEGYRERIVSDTLAMAQKAKNYEISSSCKPRTKFSKN